MEEVLRMLDSARGLLTAVGAGAVGGVLAYFVRVAEGKPFKFTDMVLHTAVSGFCGYIAYGLCSYLSLPDAACGAICGIAGWMGTRLLRLLEMRIEHRLSE